MKPGSQSCCVTLDPSPHLSPCPPSCPLLEWAFHGPAVPPLQTPPVSRGTHGHTHLENSAINSTSTPPAWSAIANTRCVVQYRQTSSALLNCIAEQGNSTLNCKVAWHQAPRDGTPPDLGAREQNTSACVVDGLAQLAFSDLDGAPAPDAPW